MNKKGKLLFGAIAFAFFIGAAYFLVPVGLDLVAPEPTQTPEPPSLREETMRMSGNTLAFDHFGRLADNNKGLSIDSMEAPFALIEFLSPATDPEFGDTLLLITQEAPIEPDDEWFYLLFFRDYDGVDTIFFGIAIQVEYLDTHLSDLPKGTYLSAQVTRPLDTLPEITDEMESVPANPEELAAPS